MGNIKLFDIIRKRITLSHIAADLSASEKENEKLTEQMKAAENLIKSREQVIADIFQYWLDKSKKGETLPLLNTNYANGEDIKTFVLAYGGDFNKVIHIPIQTEPKITQNKKTFKDKAHTVLLKAKAGTQKAIAFIKEKAHEVLQRRR